MTELDDSAFELESVTDPAVVAAALAAGEAKEAPELVDPTDGPVDLVGGYRRVLPDPETGGNKFVEVSKAWVRELNGEDEERIARARLKDDHNEFVRAVLEAGVERLGDDKPTRDDLTGMILGDREYLLMEIARATYGDELEYENVLCESCGEFMSVTLSAADDIPVKRMASIEDRNFTVNLKNGRVAKVTLPTGEIQTDMAKAETPAEANTVLIAHCVSVIEGPKGTVAIQGDKEAAKRLGIQDRRVLVKEMSERMPGPQYNEVKFKHEPGCGEEIHLRITLVDLFRGM